MSALRLWGFTAAYSLLMLGLGAGCAVAGRRNLRRFRRAGGHHPLESSEILASDPPSSGLPYSWPRLTEIDQAPVAAAYRDYAPRPPRQRRAAR